MSIDSSETAYELVARAEMLVELNRPEEALELLARAIAQNPDDGHAWCVKSLAHIKQKDYAAALEAAGAAASRAPEDPWPHQLACVALLDVPGRAQDAIAAARESVRLAPDEWRCHYLLGLALVDHPRHMDEAMDASERALELAPHEPEVHNLAGDVAIANGCKDAAREHFQRALSIDPESFVAHEGLARLRLSSRGLPLPSRFAEAAGGFATGLRVSPETYEARHNLDLSLRTAIAWVAYFLFLVGWLVARIAAAYDTVAARIIPVVTLALPGMFAFRFVRALRPDVRAYLVNQCRRGMIAIALAFAATSVGLVLAGSVVPQEDREALSAFAAISALIARIALWVEGRDREKRLRARQ